MNIAFLCVLIMGVLPYVWISVAKFGGAGANNHTPREAMTKLTGYKQRAFWAHLNQFEALPLFIAGVLVATYNHAPQHTLNLLAIIVVVLRIIYGFLYMSDLAALRSFIWFIGLGCVVAMFCI